MDLDQAEQYIKHKFATKSSCLTNQFKTDDLGFKPIEQVCQSVLHVNCFVLDYLRLDSCLIVREVGWIMSISKQLYCIRAGIIHTL